ncbi:hypothetical protein [Hymenobacter sp. GOD-10R]|uniref:hypothetical protein n=1 Tax=Hymenobacter sp. GOD-10R TaxID=3093922 RepID=UPI002D785DB3|nr:hypothetical protein [Hymenobacter sp. GOD-10R]WRQ29689.1 hypothetical protein SD425_05360 [Hymenobacter sp. GOD-10R]
MKTTITEASVPVSTQLSRFLQRVLRLTPVAFWWLVAALVFAVANLILKKEVWPNTPHAEHFFAGAALASLASLAWMAANLAWRVANTISCEPWNTTWRLAAILGFMGATGATAAAAVGIGVLVSEALF